MSRVIEIADFVVARIAEFTAGSASDGPVHAVERSYIPIYSLEELGQKVVLCVVPRSKAGTNLSRRDREIDLQIDVGIMHRPEDLQIETLDSLMEFVEELEDHLYGVEWKPVNCSLIGVQNDPIFSPEHLEENRQFSSLLSISLKYWRAR